MTTGNFTEEANAFTRGKPLELVDGETLAKLVEGVQTAQAVQQPTTTTPACPKCGGEMVQRVAKRGASAGNGPGITMVTGKRLSHPDWIEIEAVAARG